MAKLKPVRAFCGCSDDWLVPAFVAYYARDVRRAVGRAAAHNGETPEQGWVRAKRDGWRVVPVVISPWADQTEERS